MNVLFQTKKDDKLRNVYLDIFKDGRSVCTFFSFSFTIHFKTRVLQIQFQKMGTVKCEQINK